MPLLPRDWLDPVMFSGTCHSMCSWKLPKLSRVWISPFFLLTVNTPSCTSHSAGPPLPLLVHALRSLPSNRTTASDGAELVAMSPGVTTLGCGVQNSVMAGRMPSGLGYSFFSCADAAAVVARVNAERRIALFIFCMF